MRSASCLKSDVSAEAAIVLRVDNATRRYGGRLALEDVSLQIMEGEVYALIGRNGAGKSTLVKAIVGALSLDCGAVSVLGGDPARAPGARRVIGVAPQDIALYGHLTVSENLTAFATLAGVRESRGSAVRAAMDETACAERANQRIDQLSGGWRRRANLAAAIVHRPRLLVLDEPGEGLDAETRAVFRHLIGRLRARSTAILLISHDADDVTTLADRVGVLSAGRLVAEGSPHTLVQAAFGTRKTLSVMLRAQNQAAATILDGMGLSSSDGGLGWTCLIEDAANRALEIDRALGGAGVQAREITVRPPGLDSLIGWATDASAR
jgi:ABC-2 type transport system ATP-binding protein